MKHKQTVIYILGIGFALSLVTGCSDKPEAKAAKEAREQAQKAMAVVEDYKLESGYDYAAARQEVDKAVALANRAGGLADSVYFASAELTSAYASKQFVKLSEAQEDAAKELSDCAGIVLKLSACKTQMDSIDMLKNTGVQEAGELETLLNEQKLGVDAKLADAQKQLDGLNASLKGFEDAAAAAKKAADEIQAAANQMLRDAQLLEGQSRIELERKAYAMLQGNDPASKDSSVFHYNSLVQENIDQAEAVSVRINTIMPLITKLNDDVVSLAKRIDELKNQDKTLGFSTQSDSLSKQYSDLESELTERLAAFNTKFAAYRQYVADQSSLYMESQENYAKVRTEGLRANAQIRAADCSKSIASLNADAFAFSKRVADNLKHIAEVKVNDVAASFEQLRDQFDTLATEYAEATKSGYDKAFEEYQEVIDRYSSGQFADMAARNYMSAIYSRINFDTSAADAAAVKKSLLAKVEEIKEISIAADPTFANSKVAALFVQYGMEFKTAEQKLQEEFLAVKVEFAAAMSLSGQAKQDRLLELLGKFNDLERTEDEQFYNDLVKYIYDSFRDEWLAMAEEDAENEALSVLKEFITRDTQPEEEPESVGTPGVRDPNSF